MRLNPFAMNANLMKRTGAAVLDLFLWFVGILLLLRYVFAPLYDIEYGTSQLYAQQLSYQEASYLYSNYEDTEILVTIDLEDVPDALFNYYSIFKDGKVFETGELAFEFTTAWYNINVLKVDESDAIFELVNGDNNVVAILKDDVDDLDRDEFYSRAYFNALNDLFTYPPFKSLVALIERYQEETTGLSALISFTLFYLVAPFAFKQGQTLGKKVNGLAVVNEKGYFIKWWQLPIRSIFLGFTFVAGNFFGIGFFTSVLTIIIVLLVSFTLLVFTKGNRSANDFVAKTKIIDLKISKIFYNEQGLLAYENQLETSQVKDTSRFLK
jgi:uncharacterized RDD family membrane protein YckC